MPCRSALQSATGPHQSTLRKGRHSQEGLWYALTKCVNHREPILTRQSPSGYPAAVVVESINHLQDEGIWLWKGFVVMPDHFHIVVELRKGDLSRVMNNLGKYTARRINAMLGRQGTFWQRGFYDQGLRSEKSLKTHLEYMLANPVRAGLVSAPEQWPFSCVFLPPLGGNGLL